MSTKVNIRKSYIHQRRQQNFHLGQSINDMVIPNYNALKDPFLSGFFEHPGMRTNLRKTGIIVRKKLFSLQKYQKAVTDPKLLHSAQLITQHRRTKSQSKKYQSQNLPQLEGKNQDVLEQLESGKEGKPKKVFRSVKQSSK